MAKESIWIDSTFAKKETGMLDAIKWNGSIKLHRIFYNITKKFIISVANSIGVIEDYK